MRGGFDSCTARSLVDHHHTNTSEMGGNYAALRVETTCTPLHLHAMFVPFYYLAVGSNDKIKHNPKSRGMKQEVRMTHTNTTVEHLQELENASWLSERARTLYATPYIAGFPWYTSASNVGTSIPGERSVMRHVVPYDFTFKVFAKGRWVGRSLLDVYSEELAHHSPAYYERCLATGRLRCINKKSIQKERFTQNVLRRQVKRHMGEDAVPSPSSPSTSPQSSSRTASKEAAAGGGDVILQHGDIVLHTVHRHELPVTMGSSGCEPIDLLAVRIRAYGLLSVNKPTGVPTHATGRYQYNSLLSMLEYVLAPKRLRAWLWDEDPLLQSVVSTKRLFPAEKHELWDLYSSSEDAALMQEGVALDRCPRPCHRLDRVTSGILLIGVSQSATKRVSAALMRKSNDMSAAVQAVLSAARPGDEDDPYMELLQRMKAVFGVDYGIRKRYLARVAGLFPEASPKLRAALSPSAPTKSPESSRETKLLETVPIAADALIAVNQTILPEMQGLLGPGGQSTKKLCGVFPDGLLIASPVVNDLFPTAPTPASPRSNGTETTPRHPSGAEPATRRPVSQTAATLCQRVCVRPASISHDGSTHDSVVQCLPLTGRLHQIRIHLSDWGFPILGDGVYAAGPDERPYATEAKDPHGNSLVFDFAGLPPAYQDYVKATTIPCARSGTPTASTKDQEPLCYECAGKLPIAAQGTCSGASAIHLHAWVYELNEAMIREEGSLPDTTPDAKTLRSPFVMQDGASVRFMSPPPSWAS